MLKVSIILKVTNKYLCDVLHCQFHDYTCVLPVVGSWSVFSKSKIDRLTYFKVILQQQAFMTLYLSTDKDSSLILARKVI